MTLMYKQQTLINNNVVPGSHLVESGSAVLPLKKHKYGNSSFKICQEHVQVMYQDKK